MGHSSGFRTVAKAGNIADLTKVDSATTATATNASLVLTLQSGLGELTLRFQVYVHLNAPSGEILATAPTLLPASVLMPKLNSTENSSSS